MGHFIKGYFMIIRPVNCAITFVSVLVGAWIGRGIFFSPTLLLAGMIGFIACAFGNVVNDLNDIEIDKINNPQRPLPSGQVDKKNVKLLAFLFFIISIIGAISLGIAAFFLVLGVLVLLILYATHLKKTTWSNFIVALIAGLSFILGGLVAGDLYCIIPFIFSFFIHLPREIIKDVIDMKGDKSMGIASLPIVLGVKQSYNISALLLGILCILLPLPFILNVLSAVYMLVVLLFAYPIIIFTILKLSKSPNEGELNRLSNLLKISMLVGLVAVIV